MQNLSASEKYVQYLQEVIKSGKIEYDNSQFNNISYLTNLVKKNLDKLKPKKPIQPEKNETNWEEIEKILMPKGEQIEKNTDHNKLRRTKSNIEFRNYKSEKKSNEIKPQNLKQSGKKSSSFLFCC